MLSVYVLGRSGAASLRQHFDVAVDAGDHLELALIHLSLVAGDGAILAFGKDHALVPGTPLPQPQGVFPRFVEEAATS